MLSNPPTPTMSAFPSAIDWLPYTTAFRPEEHTLLMVVQVVEAGNPALVATCLAGACPTPADSTLPKITSSTWEELIPA
jgi:hypothetical protein